MYNESESGGNADAGQCGADAKREDRRQVRIRSWAFGIYFALLLLGFGSSLFGLLKFAAGQELYSHILLIPLVSAYAAWLIAKRARPGSNSGSFPDAQRRGLALVLLVLGTMLLGLYWGTLRLDTTHPAEDGYCVLVWSFLAFLYGGWIGTLGWARFRRYLFPALFLAFMAPFPESALGGLEQFLQRGSAVVAGWLFAIPGTPALRLGTTLQLPGISLLVAPECSGIHSTLVLLITSVVAAQLYLHSKWRRAALVLAVLPLALLRNGFRIFTIGELCIHYGPQMLDSWIHRRGGPLFFALSLIPLFLWLMFLALTERKTGSSRNAPPKQSA